jgi:hypothetical protein
LRKFNPHEVAALGLRDLRARREVLVDGAQDNVSMAGQGRAQLSQVSVIPAMLKVLAQPLLRWQ